MKLRSLQTLLIFLIVQNPKLIDCVNRGCSWSLPTLRIVDACPETKQDVEKAARDKNCEQWASQQNCSSVTDFKYHCVMNELENDLVEVCAPAYFIHGFCVEYNTIGAVIQEHHEIRCDEVEPPCAERYKSTDAYLYKGCYNVIKEKNIFSTMELTTIKQNTSIFHMKNDIPNDRSTHNWEIPLGVTAGCILVLVLVFILGYVFRKKIFGWCKGENTNELPDPEKDNMLPRNTSATGNGMVTSYTTTDEVISNDITAEENEIKSKEKMDLLRHFNPYFVRTKLVEDTELALEKNAVAVLTGPPGCGKTYTAYHLMFRDFYKSWTVQIIEKCNQFKFLNSDKNTLVYIDNFLDGVSNVNDLKKWLEDLTNVFYEYIREPKNRSISTSGCGNIHLLITARDDVFDKICKHMKDVRSPVFYNECIVDARTVKLSDEEKDKIFESQIKYAKDTLQIDTPAENEAFKEEIKQADGPLGFPLCANLYACKIEYRYMGSSFFSYPLEHFRTQIKKEIDADSTKKTMTLLLLLFLFESKNEDTDKSKRLDLRNENECEKLLLQCLMTRKKLSKFHPLDFSNLISVAQKLPTDILMGSKESGFYRFKHQSIREAVGNFFCTEYCQAAMEVFPLEALQFQKFSSCSRCQYTALTSRLISEIESGNVSMVFDCNAFKCDAYSEHFYRELQNYKNKYLQHFFRICDKNSIPLPAIFWISKYKLKKLLDLLSSLISEKNIDVEIHYYLGLLGEICTVDENLLAKDNTNVYGDVEKTKQIVSTYMDSEKNSILNIIIRSDRSDTEAKGIIKILLKENKNIVKLVNQHNETSLMLAVNCKQERKKVLKELINTNVSPKLSKKDDRGLTVFHHCISSDSKDKECVEYLKILLGSKLHRDLSISSEHGETALNLAAKHATHSRILSILYLIEDKDINTIDTGGRTPIHNAVALLKEVGHDPNIELEIATRITIFMVYGSDVEVKNDENCLAADICHKTHYDNIKQLLEIEANDQKSMVKILQCTLQQIEKKSSAEPFIIPNPMGRMSPKMLETIGRAAECLAEIIF